MKPTVMPSVRRACVLMLAAVAAACFDSSEEARHGAANLAAGEVAGHRSASRPAPGSCTASSSSLTPAEWKSPAIPDRPIPKPGLRTVADIPLPGPANRFDYQSVDPAAGRLYISHMNAGRLVVFDLDSGRVLREVSDVPRVTGVWAVPEHHHVYASAAGADEVAVVDDRSLASVARVGGIRFPDGIAYAREADKVFVSDESGGSDAVIDAATLRKRSTIDLDGEAGNTH
jgi:hypothetical protein